ncbi:helix-turn-helix domain-containing protein [[Ruminococcus] torques]|uniref:helix-turn-helix domain-containing protein n=1 Tax=[Ruminococcus] torques TaxID=33039 RepID=UPI003AB2D2D3
MNFSEAIKGVRQKALLSQEDFAKQLGVSHSTVNRWEKGKTLPNFKTMKRIDVFCKKNTIDFDVIGEVWTNE